jgi:hypothetical protein
VTAAYGAGLARSAADGARRSSSSRAIPRQYPAAVAVVPAVSPLREERA